MPLPKVVHREFEVAFSKRSQPVWFRIVKYIVIAILIYFLWGNQWFWPVFIILFILSLMLHFWYRHKTAGWTKSYKMWKHESER
jgi:uncharacterized membrane protein